MMAMGLTAHAQTRQTQQAVIRPTDSLPQPATHKPAKVDSDTQTPASVVHAQAMKGQGHHGLQMPQHGHQRSRSPQLKREDGAHLQGQRMSPHHSPRAHDPRRQHPPHLANSGKEHSNSSMNSDSTSASGQGEESNVSSSNSTSNSNNSASSTDSVIYKPSSCEESGLDSDSNLTHSPRSSHTNSPHHQPQSPMYTDHISSLRLQKLQQQQQQAPGSPGRAGKKKETTFDTEVRTEEREVNHSPGPSPGGKETTLGEDADTFDVDIKPMQPIMRSTPYAYLRSTNSSLTRPSLHIPSLSTQNSALTNSASASSRLGVNRPLLDPSKLYSSHQNFRRTVSNCNSVLESDYGSDVEGSDVQAGYMSDGDILRSAQPEDINCGYMSEGGVSLYAKRMQQRFREGMMAVKECMQKSSAMADEDRSVCCRDTL